MMNKVWMAKKLITWIEKNEQRVEDYTILLNRLLKKMSDQEYAKFCLDVGYGEEIDSLIR